MAAGLSGFIEEADGVEGDGFGEAMHGMAEEDIGLEVIAVQIIIEHEVMGDPGIDVEPAFDFFGAAGGGPDVFAFSAHVQHGGDADEGSADIQGRQQIIHRGLVFPESGTDDDFASSFGDDATDQIAFGIIYTNLSAGSAGFGIGGIEDAIDVEEEDFHIIS